MTPPDFMEMVLGLQRPPRPPQAEFELATLRETVLRTYPIVDALKAVLEELPVDEDNEVQAHARRVLDDYNRAFERYM